MRFHHKIILTALIFTLLLAGYRALPESGTTAQDLADPGFWMALGQGLVGAGESGWCACG